MSHQRLPPLPSHQMKTHVPLEYTGQSKSEPTVLPNNKRPAINDNNSSTTNINPRKRRTAVHCHNKECPPHSTFTSIPQHPTNININYPSTNHPFKHHIRLGPVCTACNHKVMGNNTLFDISQHNIKVHLTTNQCFTGNYIFLDLKELESYLCLSIAELYHSMNKDPSQASTIIDENFHSISSSNHFPYCY